MADSTYELPDEEQNDGPVPVTELQELNEEKRILSSVYRHVEHPPTVDQVAEVAAGTFAVDKAFSASTESKGSSSQWLPSIAQRTPPLIISAGPSEGSESISAGMHLRLSAGIGSSETGDISRQEDDAKELLSLCPSLDSALRLNMVLQRRFRDKIQKLEIARLKNIERQAKLKEEISDCNYGREYAQKSEESGKLSLRISHFCVPYFKNRSGMPAPMNVDAKAKIEAGNIDLYVTRPRTWLTVEKEKLEITVRKEWQEQKLFVNERTIRELSRKLQNIDSLDEETKEQYSSIEQSIHDLQSEVDLLSNTPTHEVVPERGEKELDWDRIAAQAFDGHRTPDECRLYWENLLHPGVNTSPFTENEDLIITKMCVNSRAKVPDWEKIAADMKTNRTGFLVMQRYVSFIENSLKPARWNKQDSDKLLNTVNMLRVGNHIPWHQVHQHLVGYSREQIQSHWRRINPEISKGPFTVEEDFLLIKGLHMFGLNFDSISHFMPGRSTLQVRERYKRTILPGFGNKPWTTKEDDTIIKECSVGSKNWKKMIVSLPRFNPCEIRSRYHILQVWQTLSGTNMIPPPLFPITSTVDPEMVLKIRKAILMESNDVTKLVEESRKGTKMKNVVKELEERRIIIKERKRETNLKRIKKVGEKRGRQRGQANPHFQPLQDIFLTDFFIPSRQYPHYPSTSSIQVQLTLINMCDAMQLKILKQVEEDEIDALTALGLTCTDVDVVQSITRKHFMVNDTCGVDCPACEKIQPVKIPMLPPCKVTIGAFKSLLVHRPKLQDMVSGEFFMDRYNRDELLRLNSNFRNKRSCRKKLDNFSLQHDQVTQDIPTVSPNKQQGFVSETEVSQDESDTEMQNNGPSTSRKRRNNSGLAKFHITRQVEQKAKQKQGQGKLKTPMAQIPQGQVKAYSKGKKSKIEVAEASSRSTEQPSIKLEINGHDMDITGENLSSRLLSHEEQNAKDESENLLFQRMLSIFFYPALMTITHPNKDLIKRINGRIDSGDLQAPDVKDSKYKSSILKKDELEIEEQGDYIRYLCEMEARQKEQEMEKKIRIKQELVEKIVSHPPAQEGTSATTAIKRESDGMDDDTEDSESMEVIDGRRFNRSLASFFRKENLKSLRRSLVMKKIWTMRRQGCYPQRTSDRDKRKYKARGSSTRNKVRKDLLVPDEDVKPWNFPVGGPLKVQPQVPVIPSQEMLNRVFSEKNEDNEHDVTNLTSDNLIHVNDDAMSILDEPSSILNEPLTFQVDVNSKESEIVNSQQVSPKKRGRKRKIEQLSNEFSKEQSYENILDTNNVNEQNVIQESGLNKISLEMFSIDNEISGKEICNTSLQKSFEDIDKGEENAIEVAQTNKKPKKVGRPLGKKKQKLVKGIEDPEELQTSALENAQLFADLSAEVDSSVHNHSTRSPRIRKKSVLLKDYELSGDSSPQKRKSGIGRSPSGKKKRK